MNDRGVNKMSTPSINPTSTSLPGITGATTPATFTDFTTSGPSYTVAAVLTASDTTITAFQAQGTTSALVVDGTTLGYGESLTLSNGDVITARSNGLEDATTTANLGPITISASSVGLIQLPNRANIDAFITVFRDLHN
jgi:hypothetical protein